MKLDFFFIKGSIFFQDIEKIFHYNNKQGLLWFKCVHMLFDWRCVDPTNHLTHSFWLEKDINRLRKPSIFSHFQIICVPEDMSRPPVCTSVGSTCNLDVLFDLSFRMCLNDWRHDEPHGSRAWSDQKQPTHFLPQATMQIHVNIWAAHAPPADPATLHLNRSVYLHPSGSNRRHHFS